jgi:hypothetical protein
MKPIDKITPNTKTYNKYQIKERERKTDNKMINILLIVYCIKNQESTTILALLAKIKIHFILVNIYLSALVQSSS